MERFVKLKHTLIAVVLMLCLAVSGVLLASCENKYDSMTISLSYNGLALTEDKTVVVTIGEDNSVQTATVIVSIDGDKSISRDIYAYSESQVLNITTEKNLNNDTVITISASEVCTNVPVIVKSLEGDKSATFFVTVEKPVQAIYSTNTNSELFVVKGIAKTLDCNKLITYSPKGTTQKDVVFSLSSTVQNAYIEDGQLFVKPEYDDTKITVKAKSSHNGLISTDIVLDVLESFDVDNITYSAVYSGSGEKVDLTSENVVLSHNNVYKQMLDITISIPTTSAIYVTPIFVNDDNSSNILRLASSESYVSTDKTTYVFTIAEEHSGHAKVSFDIGYEDFAYSVSFGELDVNVYDSISSIQLYADDVINLDTNPHFSVYDSYYGTKGLKLSFVALPTSIPDSERTLILELNEYTSNFAFYDADGKTIVFDKNNRFSFDASEEIYISATSVVNSIGKITIYAKTNDSIKKEITLQSKIGTEVISFQNAKKVGDNYVYYLTSNEELTQTIEFTMNTIDTSTLSILSSGSSYNVNSTITTNGSKYSFTISSIQDAPDEESTLIVKQANGCFAEAKIIVFYAINKDEISLSVPSEKKSSAVGKMERPYVENADFEFNVSIKQNNSATLTIDGKGINMISYAFADYVLSDDTADIYDNLFYSVKASGFDSLTYTTTSKVVDVNLINNLKQIKAMTVGKTFVHVTLTGDVLQVDEAGIYYKFTQSYDFYFLVESYVPITTISLSQDVLNLYAQNSVGQEDYAKTYATVAVNINEDATYKNISWTGRAFEYAVNGTDVYLFKPNAINSVVKVTTYSTMCEDGGEYFNADNLTFVFKAEITEFNTTYVLALTVNILRAQQVEKIAVLDANVDEGIYIPLTYDGEDITRQITGMAQIGDSGKIPYNSHLVYEFLPDFVSSGTLSSISSVVSIDKESGLITVSKDATQGVSCTIRIAPADRYNSYNQYVAGEDDVAVYIKLVIADGRSRATSYQITSLADMDNYATGDAKFLLHYTIVVNQLDVQTTSDYAIAENFNGGLYGRTSETGTTATIITNKPLFNVLGTSSTIEDLIVVGNVSGASFVANVNNGNLNNVVIDAQNNQTGYTPSILTSTSEITGGLVGTNYGTIKNSAFYGVLKAGSGVAGGIAGVNSGIIDNSSVEFYTFTYTVGDTEKTEYGRIETTDAIVGGIVGRLENAEISGKNITGKILRSYVYSYVEPSSYDSLNLLQGTSVGAVAGKIVSGEIDEAFAYVNNIQNLVINESENVIKNAYVLYRNSSAETLQGKFIVNGIETNAEYITSNDVWDVSGALPCFKAVKESTPLLEIGQSFSNEIDNVISGTNSAVMFFYDVSSSLTLQEQTNLQKLNTISFESLFGTSAYGIKANSSNVGIVKVLSDALQIQGTGKVQVTFFSKYNSQIKQTYTIYVIYPISNFAVSSNGTKIGSGAVVNTKITDGFNFGASVSNSKVLDQRELTFLSDNLNLVCTNEYKTYSTSNGLGSLIINTQALVSEEEISTAQIEYAIALVSSNYEADDLNKINELLQTKFYGNFTLNMFKGADSVQIKSSSASIEPRENVKLDVYVSSDVAWDSENVTQSEGIVVNYLQTNGYEKNLFDCEIAYIDTKTTLTTSGSEYYVHHFTLTFSVKKNYRNLDYFDANTNTDAVFKIEIIAKTSLTNNQNFGSNIIKQTFELTVQSQNVTSMNINHYAQEGKSVKNDGTSNYVSYKFKTGISNNIIAPGEEGLLKIDLYPSYALFDYVTVTYQTLSGSNFSLSLGVFDFDSSTKEYRHSTSPYETITKGIKISNTHKVTTSSLTSLYISTYVPMSVNKDETYVITVSVYKDNEVVISSEFNLIVQYLQGALIQVCDDNGNAISAIARGDSANIYITIQKDHTLNGNAVEITGWSDNLSIENNYIATSELNVVEEENSLTRTYKAILFIGSGVELTNNSNYITISASISWMLDGQLQTKSISYTLAIVDFVVDNVELLTDRSDKTSFYSYIGVQTELNFDFNGNKNVSENSAFNSFLQNHYFESLSGINSYGNYIVNFGNASASSFLNNLSYYNGNAWISLVRTDGSLTSIGSFSFYEEDGKIIIVGKSLTTSGIKMKFELPIQIPAIGEQYIKTLSFEFTIYVTQYSSEDMPLIIDNEQAFYDALTSTTAQDYILMSDLYLYDYSPYDTTGLLSLDGNNYTINIMSWDVNPDGAELNLALFNNVVSETTLKNLTVNVYNASKISVNTNVYTAIQIAGLAITNDGIIYNCEVVAFKENNFANQTNAGFNVTRTTTAKNITTNIAGFVITNNGYITNSRVGGESIQKVSGQVISLSTFDIVGEGNLSGFVDTNSNTGTIASSFFANGTITNTSVSGTQTESSGFVRENYGTIHSSYAKGTGTKEYSLTGQGITTSSISSGFVYFNDGVISNSYSNILLANISTQLADEYESGRLSAGFVYQNDGKITYSYTASKIQNAKSTQMAFVGIDEASNLLNNGSITYSYYYNADISQEEDAYSNSTANLSIIRVLSPDDESNFYGLSFADNSASHNGIWYVSAYGIDLVSANQIAISSRYIANEKRDKITNELTEYDLPYKAGYEYGSEVNPIIIRDATEFNRVFGGDTQNVGTSVASYYSLGENYVFGNYRLISDIDLSTLNPDSTQKVSVSSTQMELRGGVFDGNMLTISGVSLTAGNVSTQSFGLFSSLTNGASLMNVSLKVLAVDATQVNYVGAVAGRVDDSKLININIENSLTSEKSSVLGKNAVGGLAGIVTGNSEIKGITVSGLKVQASASAVNTRNVYSRNLTNSQFINSSICYAGGIIGIVDIYQESEKETTAHKLDMSDIQISNLTMQGVFEVRGAIVGGLIGYLGPQTLLSDVTLELTGSSSQKIVSYGLYAGGIVGECHGDIDKARTQHDSVTQKSIEDNAYLYYRNMSNSSIDRGNLTLFEDIADDHATSTYSPIAIGGIVGYFSTGKITHSYSKVNVRNPNATYAGGVVGMVDSLANAGYARNEIELYEVYAYGDVYGKSTGGIVGYIDCNRQLSMIKVNAVNYWSLAYDEQSEEYYLPSNIYEIYASTGSTTQSAKFIDEIAELSDTIVQMTNSDYSLPIIKVSTNSQDMYAITYVKFSKNGTATDSYLKQSYARQTGNAMYNMVTDPYYGLQESAKTGIAYTTSQSVTPYYDLNDKVSNGIEMDTYFVMANWDTNYWVRYTNTNDLLPSLVTYNESSTFYIDVAEDLQKMLYHPSSTFIVRALNQPSKIIKVGTYIETTGITLNNFTGVLKGLDSTQNYGFNFEDKSSFITSTVGASFYNLTITNLGECGESAYTEINEAFIEETTLTTFENMTFKNCTAQTLVNKDNYNIGIIANKMNGGYVSNISFEDCTMKIQVKSNLESVVDVNVGMVAGLITPYGNSYMQITDVCMYSTDASYVNSNVNSISINANGNSTITLDDVTKIAIEEVNVGMLAGQANGAIVTNYTSVSATGNSVKGIGVRWTVNQSAFKPDNSYDGYYNGSVISLKGAGEVGTFNAGMLYGKTSSLNMSYNRASKLQKLNVVGGITKENSCVVDNMNVGGLLGYATSSVAISNGSTWVDKYINVDVDMNLTAKNANVGMLIGNSSSIRAVDNIDTYGTIQVITSGNANVGGFIGLAGALDEMKVNNVLSYTNIITSTSIDSATESTLNVGGFIGKFNSAAGSLVIGEENFNTKFFGKISVGGKEMNVGGLVGGIESGTGELVEFKNAVVGGTISISKLTAGFKAFVGGLYGNGNIGTSNAIPCRVQDCLTYGDIDVNYDFSDLENANVYVGGLAGMCGGSTTLGNNNSLTTITTKTSSLLEKAHINALVGYANDAEVSNDESGNKTYNYYCHQMSLCLDENDDIGATNVYFNRTYEIEEDSTTREISSMKDVLENYVDTLNEDELLTEYFEGSKLNPYEMNLENAQKITAIMASEKDKMYYFLIGGKTLAGQQLTTLNKTDATIFPTVDLVSSHVIGDGIQINETSSLFGIIDESSRVSGFTIVPTITVSSTQSDGTYNGAGTLANVNNGFVFACTVKSLDIASSTPNVSSSVSGFGGFVGVNNGEIVDCMASIKIESNGQASGFVGRNNGLIVSSYSVGAISGSGSNFAFASGEGKIVNSYSAMTANTGVFGSNTLIDCYYDLYATQSTDDQNFDVVSETKTMSVIQESDESNNLFFDNSALSKKFAYQYDVNFGYPTFSGTQYKNLEYMQGIATGTGEEDDRLMINSIGKLQQLNEIEEETEKAKQNFKLICDISLTEEIETIYASLKTAKNNASYTFEKFDFDFKVVDWEPITEFIGTITGAKDGESQYYKIANLKNTTSQAWSIFNKLNGATVESLIITSDDKRLVSSASQFAALAVSTSGNTTIKNINVEYEQYVCSISSANSVTVGGLLCTSGYAEDSGATVISNCTMSLTSISFGDGASATSATFGGLIGETTGATQLNGNADSISFKNAVTITSKATGETYIGGIVGNATEQIFVYDVTFKGKLTLSSATTGSANAYVGGAFGAVVSSKLSSGSFEEDVTLLSTGNGEFNAGLYAGLAEATTFNAGNTGFELGTDKKAIFTNTTFGNNNIGMYIGQTAGDGGDKTSISGLSEFTIKNENCKITLPSETTDVESTNYIGGLVGVGDSFGLVETTISGNISGVLTVGAKAVNYVGAVAGKLDHSLLNHVTVKNYLQSGIRSDNVGAVASEINNSTLTAVHVVGCSLESKYKTTDGTDAYIETSVGGISGVISNTTINQPQVLSTIVKIQDNGTGYAGGIAGKLEGNTSINTITVNTESGSSTKTTITGYDGCSVGGIAGLVTGEVTIATALADTGDSSEQTHGINCCVEIKKNEGTETALTGSNAGGVVGKLESAATFTSLDVKGSTITIAEGAEGNAGGVAGYVTGAAKFTNMLVSNVSVQESSTTESLSSAGGVVGRSDGNMTVAGVISNNGLQVTGSYYAGGVLGYGQTSKISNNGAIVYESGGFIEQRDDDEYLHLLGISIEAGETAESGIVYAGGVVGYLLSGEVSNCLISDGSVTAGNSGTIETKLNARDFFYYEGGQDDETGAQTIAQVQSQAAKLNNAQKGPEESYAGGLVGYSQSTNVINSRCSTNVSAHAKVTLNVEEYFHYNVGGTSYDAIMYYMTETENAYASGIVNLADSSSFDITCFERLSGTLEGGGIINYNMYSHDDGSTDNIYRTYILNYSIDDSKNPVELGSYWNSLYQDVNDSVVDGARAWKDAIENGNFSNAIGLSAIHLKTDRKKDVNGNDLWSAGGNVLTYNNGTYYYYDSSDSALKEVYYKQTTVQPNTELVLMTNPSYVMSLGEDRNKVYYKANDSDEEGQYIGAISAEFYDQTTFDKKLYADTIKNDNEHYAYEICKNDSEHSYRFTGTLSTHSNLIKCIDIGTVSEEHGESQIPIISSGSDYVPAAPSTDNIAGLYSDGKVWKLVCDESVSLGVQDITTIQLTWVGDSLKSNIDYLEFSLDSNGTYSATVPKSDGVYETETTIYVKGDYYGLAATAYTLIST